MKTGKKLPDEMKKRQGRRHLAFKKPSSNCVENIDFFVEIVEGAVVAVLPRERHLPSLIFTFFFGLVCQGKVSTLHRILIKKESNYAVINDQV